MKSSALRLTLAALMIVAAADSYGQRPASGRRDRNRTETETVSIDSLLARRQRIVDNESSLRSALERARDVYASSPSNRDAVGKRIVELEDKISELNRMLESIDAAIASMPASEAVGVATNTPNVTPTPSAGGRQNGKAILVENDYFRENLPAAEYQSLLSAQRQERNVADMFGQLKSNYDRLTDLTTEYAVVPKGVEADSLFAEITALAAENRQLAAYAGEMWNRIYETKLYAYIYLLDRANHYDLIAEQERQMNTLTMRENELAGAYMYDEATCYALEKELLTECEKRIAHRAGLQTALDSLSRLRSVRASQYFMPTVDTRERMFYDYADALPAKPVRYTNSSQIPQVEIFSRGDMYRILLGSYAKVPAVSTFKGFYPLSHEQKSDGRHYYYAGGYSTFEEAQAACDRIKKSGFANARTVAWHDGRYDSEPRSGQSASAKRYRVEISGCDNGLSSTVRDLISNRAAGREVSRRVDKSGTIIFTVSSFDTSEQAESLRNAIQSAESGLTVSVSTVD